MIAQIWALLIYGGVQAASLTPDDVVLANEPKFIRSFADIIGLNAIFTGLLWVLYVVKFKKMRCCKVDINKLFKGTPFQSIIFMIDMSFDFVYTIFPLTLYQEDGHLLFNERALATLHSEDGILFFAAFVAMVLLFKKCFQILRNFDPVRIQKRGQKIQKAHLDLTPYTI